MFEALASVDDMAFHPTLAVVTLIIGTAVREVDRPDFGPVGVVPDLLGIENKIDGEELFANQLFLEIHVL